MKNKKIYFVLWCVVFGLVSCTRTTIDLAGEWQFVMGDEPIYNDCIELPGSMLTNGKGYDVSLTTRWTGSIYDSSYYYSPQLEAYRNEGNLKFPFFLTPNKYYVGNAWYSKKIHVPNSWKDRPIT
jgi:hypothetical protein